MVIRVILLICLFTSTLFAECKDSNFFNGEIQSIKIDFHEEKKFITKVSRYYISSKQEKSLRKKINKKKRHKAKIIVFYDNGNFCEYKAKIRMHGDGLDHIKLINGTPTSSLNVRLENGNIKNITRFILFLPNSRNYDNEIFTTTFFKHLNFLSPRTFKINAKVHNNNVNYIFQESLKKEFLEFNNRIEGPILESKEDMDKSNLEMSRVSNIEWIKDNKNKYQISLNSIKDYNFSLLKSYKFRKIAGDETIRLDRLDFAEEEFEMISTFDALMYALGAAHGLSYDDRRFYYDPIFSVFEPIYYDGNSNILSRINYDFTSGKFKKKLKSWKLIKDPHLNISSNLDRPEVNRYRNPTVTYSAKYGAVKANDLVKKIDINLLLNELIKNGFTSITYQELKKLISYITFRLDLISTAEVYDKNIELEGSLYLKYENKMKLQESINDDFKLIFKKNEKNSVLDGNIEECNYQLSFCKKYLISKKEVNKLLEQKKLNSKKSIFLNFTKNNYKSGNLNKNKETVKNNFKEIKISDNLKIYVNKDVQVSFDKKKKIIDLNYFSNLGRTIIFDSKIDTWTIKMNNLSKNKNNEFDNIYNLTGCLTLIDSSIKNIKIFGNNFNCEDTVNLIRSNGSLNYIEIKNAKSDALDADFSQLTFKNLDISNSYNDCLDLSFGNYTIESTNLKKCGDKSISIGEKSNISINNLKTENSNTGIAVKDSSYANINNVFMSNLDTCLSVYNKKQEFNGGTLKIKNFKCQNTKNKIYKDSRSILVIENEL